MAKFSQSVLFFMIGFALISCRSISHENPGLHRDPAAGKATLDPEESAQQVEINVETIYSPRRFSELESTLLLHPDVQDCLRAALTTVESQNLNIGIEGRISYTGDTDEVRIETPSEPLRACLETHVRGLKHGRGIQGPFKLLIHGPRGAAPSGKGLIIDLQPVKKFE